MRYPAQHANAAWYKGLVRSESGLHRKLADFANINEYHSAFGLLRDVREVHSVKYRSPQVQWAMLVAFSDVSWTSGQSMAKLQVKVLHFKRLEQEKP